MMLGINIEKGQVVLKREHYLTSSVQVFQKLKSQAQLFQSVECFFRIGRDTEDIRTR